VPPVRFRACPRRPNAMPLSRYQDQHVNTSNHDRTPCHRFDPLVGKTSLWSMVLVSIGGQTKPSLATVTISQSLS
ncbi:MAG TPA: hypothetical protein VGA09_00740, partial [Candidatus Binatia bacterium]